MFMIDADTLRQAVSRIVEKQQVEKTTDELVREELARREKHEAETVGAYIYRNGQRIPVTIAELRKAFDKVANSVEWKKPIARIVPFDELLVTAEAITFYHGVRPTMGAVHTPADSMVPTGITVMSTGYAG